MAYDLEQAPSPGSPELYGGSIETDFNYVNTLRGNILNRGTSIPSGAPDDTVTTYNNDTPVFELPRQPVLSLGELQHMQLVGQPPFAIGNSWAADDDLAATSGGGTIGSLFDRFIFSGISPYPFTNDGDDDNEWDPNKPFPFFHLRMYNPDNSFDLAAFRGSPSPYWTQNLLMAGAFNVNSTSVAAWEAVLKSLRPPAPDNWLVANLDPDHGTQVSSSPTLNVVGGLGVQDLTQGGAGTMAARPFGFLRFSQTIQETFETDEGEPYSGFDRSPFRQGFRGGSTGAGGQEERNLTSDDIEYLAEEIVVNIREAATAGGGRLFLHWMISSVR
jgi:hypothetical protein